MLVMTCISSAGAEHQQRGQQVDAAGAGEAQRAAHQHRADRHRAGCAGARPRPRPAPTLRARRAADVQRAAGRSQSPELLDDVCTLARSCGLDCVQFDLMVGLPLQTPERWQRTLERLVQLGPDRVRLRHYRHRPRLMASQATIDASTLPDRYACQALERQAARVLQDAGYGPLASDLFVLDDDSGWMAFEQGPARHAVRHGGQWPQLGLGVGAASRIDGRVFFSDARWDAWRDAVADGRLPVTHTRRLAWYTPGEARRDSSCPCDDHEDAARPRAAGVSGPLS
jgi:hypothetical protein